MHMYRKLLLLLKELLHKCDDVHWESWIDRDIYEWDNFQSTLHHRQAFGGMGSINDLFVGGKDREGAWSNNLFDMLKAMSWSFATSNKFDVKWPAALVIEGEICKNCYYRVITEAGLENFLSKKHLPNLIDAILPTDSFYNLTKVEELPALPMVQSDRERLIVAVADLGISLNKDYIWPNACPVCSNPQMWVYRWAVSYAGKEIKLEPSKDNVPLDYKDLQVTSGAVRKPGWVDIIKSIFKV